jgi:hypothetical protein
MAEEENKPQIKKTLGQKRQENKSLLITKADRHTGETIPRKTQEDILASLTQGSGIKTLAKLHGVSDHSIDALISREIESNPKFAEAYYRSRTPARLMHLAHKAISRMEEEIQNLPPTSLPVVMGVALDKYALLSGQSTQVVEHRHVLSSNDARSALSGDVIDV